MRYNKNYKRNFRLDDLINRLIKESKMPFDEFMELLSKATDTFFESAELEFELLLSNGLPLDIDKENNVYLTTAFTKIEEQSFCIVDIETNGSSVRKGAQVIELGAVKYKNHEIVDRFQSLVYAKNIPEYVQEVTQINPNMLKDSPPIKRVLEEFKDFLGDDLFVAHNIKFDYGFISDSFEKFDLGRLLNRKLCTIDLARRCIKAEKYGLSTLKDTLNIDVDNHHRAYYDALATTYILEECINAKNEHLVYAEDLIKLSKSSKLLKDSNYRNSNREKEN